jgi:5,5'-dehydrodivanillate O-demethylase oxygenase subunit
MLSQEQNDRLTHVGPGTPCGNLLRRYWHPICATAEVAGDHRKKRARRLGEDLVVYRNDDGSFAAVQEQCPHRAASLYFGFIEPDGIRCCYHGWKYDRASGACVERPFEKTAPPPGLKLPTYRVRELSGLLFVYMGPDQENPPELPRWDVLARSDRPKHIRMMPRHKCNWLQIQENTVDSVHTYYLHGHMSKLYNLPTMVNGIYYYRPIEMYDWSVSRWGVEKTIAYGGERPEIEIRPPLIFPNILRIPEGPVEALHFRVPVDDEHTDIIWIGLRPAGSAQFTNDRDIPVSVETDPPDYSVETVSLATFYGQDRVVWETQGIIADRTRETLGASDRGIVMYRRMLEEQIARVERGEAPDVGVVMAAENECIEFANETRPWTTNDFSTAS